MVTRVITKNLAGEQDMLFGTGTKSQTRNSTAYNMSRIDKIHIVNTISDLSALSIADEDFLFSKVLVLGYTLVDDNSGGIFWYDSTEPHTNHNGYTILIAEGSSVNGCWIKLMPPFITSANLLNISHDVNNINKYEGKQIWDSIAKKPLWAKGSAVGDVWIDGTGATVYTPV